MRAILCLFTCRPYYKQSVRFLEHGVGPTITFSERCQRLREDDKLLERGRRRLPPSGRRRRWRWRWRLYYHNGDSNETEKETKTSTKTTKWIARRVFASFPGFVIQRFRMKISVIINKTSFFIYYIDNLSSDIVLLIQSHRWIDYPWSINLTTCLFCFLKFLKKKYIYKVDIEEKMKIKGKKYVQLSIQYLIERNLKIVY